MSYLFVQMFSPSLSVQFNNSSWLLQLCLWDLPQLLVGFQLFDPLRSEKKICSVEHRDFIFIYFLWLCCDTELQLRPSSVSSNIIPYWQSWISYQWLLGVEHRRILCSECCPPRREDSAPQGATIIINSCSSFPSFVWRSIITPPGEWFPLLITGRLHRAVLLPLSQGKHTLHFPSAFLFLLQIYAQGKGRNKGWVTLVS